MSENNNSSSEAGGISANDTSSNGSPNSTIESWSDRSPDNTIDSEDSMVPISFEADKRLSDPSLWGKRVATDTIVYSRPRHLHLIGEPMPQGKKLIDKLFKEKTFSDVKIYCEGKVFECHRCILGAQSDVFRGMLLNKDVTKSGTKQLDIGYHIKITDISAVTMEDLIDFMYHNDIPCPKITGDLVIAAKKYRVYNLACQAMLHRYPPPALYIGKLFLGKKFSDVKIFCEDKVFDSHRCILAGHSDVFEAMFRQRNMTEANSGEVKVTESAETMEAILHFMYYDELRPWHTISGDLLLAADKYNIPDLVRICVDGLSKRIDRKNAVEILVWAYLTSQEKMFRLASKYIFERRTNGESLRTKAWEDFKERRPALAFEIMNEAMFPAVPESKPCHKLCTKFHPNPALP